MEVVMSVEKVTFAMLSTSDPAVVKQYTSGITLFFSAIRRAGGLYLQASE